MSVGKYSPTVGSSYAMDQNWWERNGGGFGNGNNPESDNDNDGYDSYGYSENGNGPDRAGYTENEYLENHTQSEINEEESLIEQISTTSTRLLGDLNEYVNIYSILKNSEFSKDDTNKLLKLYRDKIIDEEIKTNKINDEILSPYLLSKGYIHESRVDDFIEKCKNTLNPTPTKKKTKSFDM